ncbi:MAG: hypothetical protein LBL00_07980, partial [Endomicrobium sp.]|nr:hypothetical protein [Endomicrobium sp.]
ANSELAAIKTKRMPLKQPNLIIFKNLSLIDSLRGGERQRQRLTTKAKSKSKRQIVLFMFLILFCEGE